MVFTRSDFEAYIRHFNRKEYDLQHKFYHPTTGALKLPKIPNLVGSEAIRKHYNHIHDLADEVLDIEALMFDNEADPRKIFFQNISWFRFKKDNENPDPVEAKAGDLCRIRVWIMYDVNEDGTFGQITCNLYDQDNYGPVDIPPVEPGHIRPL